MQMKRAYVVVLAALAIGAMLLLAGSLSQIEFAQGRPFSLEEGRPELDDEASVSAALPPVWQRLFSTLVSAAYIAALVYMPFALVYMILSKEARRQALRRLAPLLMILVFYLLIRTRPEVFNWVGQIEPLNLETEPKGPVEIFTPTPPNWIQTFTNVGLGLLLAAALGLVSWRILRKRQSPDDALEQLAQEAQNAIDALQAGANLKDTILSCYFEMGRVLSEERGITRDEDMTPREFAASLESFGLPPKPIGELTHLFETVRYGAKSAELREEQQAIQCLTAIIEACRAMRERPAHALRVTL